MSPYMKILSLLLGTLLYSKEVELHSTNHEVPSTQAVREEEESREQVQDPDALLEGCVVRTPGLRSLRCPLGSQGNPRYSLLIRRFTRKWEPSAGSRMRNKIRVGRGRI